MKVAKHEYADPAEFQVATGPLLTLGVDPREYLGPRPDLNGLRLLKRRQMDVHDIYLVDRGFRRQIPNLETYLNLFRDFQGLVTNIDIETVPPGPPITSGAFLMRGLDTAAVYFVD